MENRFKVGDLLQLKPEERGRLPEYDGPWEVYRTGIVPEGPTIWVRNVGGLGGFHRYEKFFEPYKPPSPCDAGAQEYDYIMEIQNVR